jgi:hypothetical protein
MASGPSAVIFHMAISTGIGQPPLFAAGERNGDQPSHQASSFADAVGQSVAP